MSFSEHILNHTKHTIAVIAAAAALAVLICVLPMLLSGAGDAPAVKVLTAAECVYAADGDGSDDSYITKSGFPDSYLGMLAELHEQHPSWKFTPVKTSLKWKDAVAKMTANPGVNTIWYSYTPAYKSVVEGRYNYLTDTYSGGKFPAASEKAVKYFMDPRNFLNERNVFLFEDRTYHDYQKLGIVKKILRRNEVLLEHAKVFQSTGKKYNISPMYLASKSFAELGTSAFMMDGHKFKYGGVKYKDCYNAYNIGASDSLGAVGGLIYANGGKAPKDYAPGPATSYGRKWDTPSKAIRGGAKFLNSSFIKNNQATAYTEHFNVLNGMSAVGTHVYMTALNGGISIAGQISEKYSDYDIFDKPLEFYIPVYKKMPSSPCGRPSASTKKDNNYYLKKLHVKYTVPAEEESEEESGEAKLESEEESGEAKLESEEESGEAKHESDKKSGKSAKLAAESASQTITKKFIKTSKLNYKTAFKLKVPANVKKVKIIATAACQPSSKKKGAVVEGAGTMKLTEGTNEFIVVCKSSTGLKRNYRITVTRG